jgi:hypothetical protein
MALKQNIHVVTITLMRTRPPILAAIKQRSLLVNQVVVIGIRLIEYASA